MSNTAQRSVRDGVSLPEELQALHVGIVLHDPETGAMLDANRRLERLYGYTAVELRTLTIETLSANTYSYTQAAAERRIRAAADGDPQRFEWRIKRADGELIWVSIHLTRVEIDGGSYVLAEVTDITEYKHNDRRVSLFYRLLRHNLHNDINVVSGFARHIESVADSDAAVQAARKIGVAASNLSRISESVKQIEHTITHSHPTWRHRSAREVIVGIVDGLEYPSATVSVIESTEMWIAVGDAFDDALTHAIENAIVHSDSTTPRVRVVVDESPNTGRVEIRIEDEGPPIPAMEIEALDEHTETTPTSHGSGVGLFVMKWCIESLGGELKIDRGRGPGNTVYFYLPPKKPAETDR